MATDEAPAFPTIDEEDEEEVDPVTPENAAARVVHGNPPPKKKPGKAARAGAGFAGVPVSDPRLKRTWEAKEADFMWSEMVAELRRIGAQPYDIDARVVRMDPPPQYTMPGAINGNSMSGSEAETPGDMLLRIVDDNYHMPAMHSAATYDVMFMWKSTGQLWGRGRLGRPSRDEIMAVRMATQRNKQQQPPPPVPFQAQGYGAPQYQQPQYPPQQQQPPYGYGAPLQQPAQQDPAQAQLIEHLIRQNQAVFEWIKQQGMSPPVGLAAPPPPPPVPVYQPPPPAPAPQPMGFGADIEQMVGAMERMRHIGGRINSALGLTVVDPRTAPAEEPDAPSAAEEPKDDGLPFHVIPIPETTLKFAKNKETGDIDWQGTAIANADSEIAKKVVGLASDFVQGIVRAAGVKTDGTILPERQPPQLHGANGTAGGGWRP